MVSSLNGPSSNRRTTDTNATPTSRPKTNGAAPAASPGPGTPAAPDRLVRARTASTGARNFVSSGPVEGGLSPAELARANGVNISSDLRTVRTTAVGERSAAPKAPPYDPGSDAKELYESMHGGMFGAGTDEDRLLGALKGKTPEQIKALEAEYKDHYGRDLRADIDDELGGSDLTQAKALLKGDQAAGDAANLYRAMKGGLGLGTDEAQIFSTLEGKSPAEVDAIKKAYQAQTGESLDAHLKEELSGAELDRARGLTEGDPAKATAARLNEAMKGGLTGAGTDEDEVFKSLEGKTAEEREAIFAAYDAQYGGGKSGVLQSHIREELSGAELDRANALLEGDTAAAEAAKIEHATNGGFLGMGTDEDAINSAFEGKSAEERQAIEAAYNGKYGDLRAELKDELGEHDLGKATALLENGRLTDAEQIYYASAGLGTDEDKIHKTLEGKSKAEIAQLREDYQRQFGTRLDDTLTGELSGRDLFDAQMSMKGAPETAKEALDQANERYAYERKGPWNAVSNTVMDAFTDKGELLDRNNARANAAYASGMEKGFLNTSEQERVRKLSGFSNMDVQTYREAKDSMADTAGTVAATAASVAVVVGTAGTAAPAVVALMAGAAGATARVTTSGLISGQGYSAGDALKDAGVGAVDGAFTVVGAGAGNAAAKGLVNGMARNTLSRAGVKTATRELTELTSKELLERSVVKRVVLGSVQGATDGAVGGAAGGAAMAGFDDKTWDQGLGQGLERVATGAAMGAGLGAGAGGLIGGGMSPLRKDLGIIDENLVMRRFDMGDNHWQTVGRYDDMLTVNRAVEPKPRVVKVAGPSGPQPVKIYGAANAAEAGRIERALGRMSELPGGRNIPTEVHVRSHIGDITDAARKPVGGIGGLGGDGQRVMIARNSLGSDDAVAHVIHHEVGHNIDNNLGRLSEGRGAHLFGKGDTVSPYAAKNAVEDFAETHRVVVRDFDRILADPDRYLQGDIGKKIEFIMEEVYGTNPRTGVRTAPPGNVQGPLRTPFGPVMPSDGQSFLRMDQLEASFGDVSRRLGSAERKLAEQQAKLDGLDAVAARVENRGYWNPGHHDPTSPNFRGGGSMTTHLPPDAEEVFQRAIPEAGRDGRSWWGLSNNGDWYRFQGGPGEPVHWNGATGASGGGRAIEAHNVPGAIKNHQRLREVLGDQQARVNRLQTELADAEFARDYARLEFSEAVAGATENPALRQMSYGEVLQAARDASSPHHRAAGDLLRLLGIGVD
ncbi:MAG: hypothetical protein KC933_13620 [Myxococcales bacterium]|nr:hypothetical protein [Myxococcales bacterium]